MGARETNILKLCQLEAAKFGCLLLRNNRGMFLTLDGKRKVRAGLQADGSSDLVGWTPLIITEEMIGKKIAVFVVCEVKEGKGRLSKEQLSFLKIVNECGGLGIVAYDQEDVKKCLITGESNVSLFDKGDGK